MLITVPGRPGPHGSWRSRVRDAAAASGQGAETGLCRLHLVLNGGAGAQLGLMLCSTLEALVEAGVLERPEQVVLAHISHGGPDSPEGAKILLEAVASPA